MSGGGRLHRIFFTLLEAKMAPGALRSRQLAARVGAAVLLSASLVVQAADNCPAGKPVAMAKLCSDMKKPQSGAGCKDGKAPTCQEVRILASLTLASLTCMPWISIAGARLPSKLAALHGSFRSRMFSERHGLKCIHHRERDGDVSDPQINAGTPCANSCNF